MFSLGGLSDSSVLYLQGRGRLSPAISNCCSVVGRFALLREFLLGAGLSQNFPALLVPSGAATLVVLETEPNLMEETVRPVERCFRLHSSRDTGKLATGDCTRIHPHPSFFYYRELLCISMNCRFREEREILVILITEVHDGCRRL